MKSLPLPIRLAAGLAAAAVEKAAKLPEELAGLPVTMASQALQLSMRVQQRVTELAIKGDEALAGLRTVEDQPDWATFDEDADEGSGATVHDFLRREEPSAAEAAAEDLVQPTSPKATGDTAQRATPPPSADDRPSGEVESIEPDLRKRTPSRPRPSGVRRHPARPSAGPPPVEDAPAAPGASASSGRAASEPGVSADASAPAGLTGFDDMSVAQVRGKLRTLSPDQLEELLAYERAHGARERFITMLANRLRTVRAADE